MDCAFTASLKRWNQGFTKDSQNRPYTHDGHSVQYHPTDASGGGSRTPNLAVDPRGAGTDVRSGLRQFPQSVRVHDADPTGSIQEVDQPVAHNPVDGPRDELGRAGPDVPEALARERHRADEQA